jgi:hypothetical protein
MSETHENLKTIRFEGEMLPKWAQLLDSAARLCPVSEETRGWFSRFTRSSGVDDAVLLFRESKLQTSPDSLEQRRARHQKHARTTPPSTRRAAPLVAAANGLQT